MANPQNLKPFKKGYDPRRNTEGRPPGPDLNRLLDKALEKVVKGDLKERTMAELIIERMMQKAIVESDTAMIKLIWDRRHGKVSNGGTYSQFGNERIELDNSSWPEQMRKALHKVYGPKVAQGQKSSSSHKKG